ncbi:hypothetical protein [Streptomyces flavofungini]|uniref:Zinc-finger domain-containing protein n=1 Tax=Streptomyces flavofungini TaxID=68200 RepID=A0ABS0X0P0_9ACTN|nr:hypothetical protein [Streptomyces flavofungini]MBJ3806752.1 hypothetical protein [Streptomyces flavofungini]GHC60777.1 hypothetical protein GCM10010349_30290 [Streptomyces flavofungini]
MTVADDVTAHADELYRIHLRHLDDCQTCRTQDDCERGTRLRRAVRAARLTTDARPRRSTT